MLVSAFLIENSERKRKWLHFCSLITICTSLSQYNTTPKTIKSSFPAIFCILHKFYIPSAISYSIQESITSRRFPREWIIGGNCSFKTFHISPNINVMNQVQSLFLEVIPNYLSCIPQFLRILHNNDIETFKSNNYRLWNGTFKPLLKVFDEMNSLTKVWLDRNVFLFAFS